MEDKKKEKVDDKLWWQPAIMIFLRMSVWIAGPIIFGTFLGRWLDQEYGTEPWLFIGVVGAAFFISMIGLVMETKKEYKKIEKQGDIKKQKKI